MGWSGQWSLLLSLAVGAMASSRFLADFGCSSFADLIEQDLSSRNPPPPNPAEDAAGASAEEFEDEEEEEEEQKATDQEVIVEEASSLSVPSGSSSCSASRHQRPTEPDGQPQPRRPAEPDDGQRQPRPSVIPPWRSEPAPTPGPPAPPKAVPGRPSSAFEQPAGTASAAESAAAEAKARALAVYRMAEQMVRQAAAADAARIGENVSAKAYASAEATFAHEGQIRWQDRGPRGDDAPERWKGQKRRPNGRYANRGGDPERNAWYVAKAAAKAKAKGKGKDKCGKGKGSKSKDGKIKS